MPIKFYAVTFTGRKDHGHFILRPAWMSEHNSSNVSGSENSFEMKIQKHKTCFYTTHFRKSLWI